MPPSDCDVYRRAIGAVDGETLLDAINRVVTENKKLKSESKNA